MRWAALLLTGCTWRSAPPAPTCAEPLVAAGGLCCWTGQVEIDGRCAGAPSACPDGWAASADGCRAVGLEAGPVVTVPAGTTLRGCDPTLVDFCGNAWAPQQEVTLTRPFLMMAHEVTRAQHRALTGQSPSRVGGCDACPVDSVSWLDAVRAANLWSLHDGLEPAYVIDGEAVTWRREASGWRLPTEAEWEHAARGGERHRYAGSDDASEVAWWEGDNQGGASPVMTRAPNALGLYDLSGNVWEWVWDHPGPRDTPTATDPAGPDVPVFPEPKPGSRLDEHIVKGGAWADWPQALHPGYRGFIPATHRGVELGYRLVRWAPEP